MLLLTVHILLEVFREFQNIFKSTSDEMLLIYIDHAAIPKEVCRSSLIEKLSLFKKGKRNCCVKLFVPCQ